MDEGSLADVLAAAGGPLPAPIVATITAQATIHRDLKPANILLNSRGEVKIGDFGIATYDRTLGHSTGVGTTTYMSPERIQGLKYGPPSDIWSLGLVACECVLGGFPLPTNLIRLLQQVAQQPCVAFPPSVPPACRACLLRCLQAAPPDRPTASVLLTDPFLADAPRPPLVAWLAALHAS
eukprot:NODE_83_length_1997_cov_68.260780_g63_i0.p3 GENE.NODE_83_length_1997_cov_68.260780_g63_i0~~NODE_83_length_1997_cov_68.260780_g63_i0.p3  ORF type:complete len:180 (-),score=63.72 NODE_83_length_1997_cov_68.260780_g63_i0:17-556(-)